MSCVIPNVLVPAEKSLAAISNFGDVGAEYVKLLANNANADQSHISTTNDRILFRVPAYTNTFWEIVGRLCLSPYKQLVQAEQQKFLNQPTLPGVDPTHGCSVK